MTVTLLGTTYEVKLPTQFAIREELVVAYDAARTNFSQRQRVLGAVLGLCTGIGKESGFDFVRARFDVLGYGGAVYGWLREKGVSMADVAAQGAPIVAKMEADLFPREAEVAAAAGFSGATAGPTG